MKFLAVKIVFMLLLAFAAVQTANAQDNWWKNKKFKTEEKRLKYGACKSAFVNIGDGFLYSNVFNITPYFDSEVYLSIMNDDKGYFNEEQGRYIIDEFLTNNPVASFKWRNSSVAQNYAFATGKYKYKKNGYINSSTVSVSLKYINGSWLIDQININ
jgi:Domain of unknown function (DUF4783)